MSRVNRVEPEINCHYSRVISFHFLRYLYSPMMPGNLLSLPKSSGFKEWVANGFRLHISSFDCMRLGVSSSLANNPLLYVLLQERELWTIMACPWLLNFVHFQQSWLTCSDIFHSQEGDRWREERRPSTTTGIIPYGFMLSSAKT